MQALLTENEFRKAVRSALRCYTRPDLLQDNPLLRCQTVTVAVLGKPEAANRVYALRNIIKKHVQRIGTVPKNVYLQRVLEYSYLNPRRTQLETAHALGLSPRTHRRHLAAAVSLLTAYLWEAERNAAAANASYGDMSDSIAGF